MKKILELILISTLVFAGIGCGGGGGGGASPTTPTPAPSSTVSITGTLSDLAKPSAKDAELRAVSSWAGATLQVLDASGAVVGTGTVNADGSYSVSVPPGSNYFIRVQSGNLVLKAFVPSVAAATAVNVNTTTTAEVLVLSQILGVANIGDANVSAATAIAAIDVATVVTKIKSDINLPTLAAALATEIAGSYNASATTPVIGAASASVSATVTTIAGNITATPAVASTVPAAPAGVSAFAGSGQVTVSWSAVTGATSYNVYYRTTAGVTIANGTKIPNATSPATITGLTNGTAYYFVVTAVNSVGEGAISSEVSATPSAGTTTLTTKAGKIMISTAGTPYGAGFISLPASLAISPSGYIWGYGPTLTYSPFMAKGLTSVAGVCGDVDTSIVYALKSDGTVWQWSGPTQVSGLSNIITIVQGGYGSHAHTVALKSDGTVWSWGDNSYGQLGDGTTGSSGTPIQAAGLTGVAKIHAGQKITTVVKDDGSVWQWGTWNALGSSTNSGSTIPKSLGGSGIVDIAIGVNEDFELLLFASGKVQAAGNNAYGQLGDGTLTTTSTFAYVTNLTGVIDIAAGDKHALAVKSDGTVWAWGSNLSGQLGTGDFTASTIPVQVSGLTNVVAVRAGPGFSMAIKRDGTVWAWGDNKYAQLGDGTTTNRTTPVQFKFSHPAVTGLTATADSGQVSLTWTAVSSASSYNVYWSTSANVTLATGTKIANITGTSYTHTGLVYGGTYYYAVTAEGGGVESAASVKIQAVSSGILTVGGDGKNNINWTAVAGANSYNIYWSTSPGVTIATGTKITGVTSPYIHTGLTNGTTYYYIVTAVSAGGESVISVQLSAMPQVPTPKFAYVANYATANVSVYTINPTTGALTAGTAVTGVSPISITVDPWGKFAYVANSTSANVSVYTINPTTGALTAGTAVAAGSSPYSVTVDPTGKFAYVANLASNDVSVYTINQMTGALTAGTAVAAGTNPISITVDLSGKFAYVANYGSANVSVYTINATTGALTAGTAVAAGSSPYSVTVDPTGKFAYVANYGSANVSVYTINQTTGALTAGTAVAAGTQPKSVTVDPSGKFAYATNYNGGAAGTVSVYTINQTTGALTAGTAVAAGTGPQSVTVDPSGKFAYVANFYSNNVSVYAINQTSGALTEVTGSPFAAGTHPASVAVTR